MPTRYAWEIYCTDDGGFQKSFSVDNVTAPTTCPNNAVHAVVVDSARYVEDKNEGNTTGVLVVSADGSAVPLLNQPFNSISAALAEAALSVAADPSSKQTVVINPGVYAESGLTPPANTSVIGTSREATAIKVAATATTSLFTVSHPNITLANLSLEIDTSTNGINATGVDVTSNNGTFAMKNVGVVVAAPSTTTGTQHALHCTGADAFPAQIINCDLAVQGGGTSLSRAAFLDAAGHVRLHACTLSANGASSNSIALETDVASAYAIIEDCVLDGTSADIKQTQGDILLNTGCTLKHGTSGGKPFSATFEGGWLFSSPGEASAGTTYLFRNATPSAPTVVEYPITTPTAVFGMRVSCAENNGGDAVFTVCKRTPAGITTNTVIACTIGTGATSASDTAHGVAFAAGDFLTVKMVRGAYGILDASVQLNMF